MERAHAGTALVGDENPDQRIIPPARPQVMYPLPHRNGAAGDPAGSGRSWISITHRGAAVPLGAGAGPEPAGPGRSPSHRGLAQAVAAGQPLSIVLFFAGSVFSGAPRVFSGDRGIAAGERRYARYFLRNLCSGDGRMGGGARGWCGAAGADGLPDGIRQRRRWISTPSPGRAGGGRAEPGRHRGDVHGARSSRFKPTS